MFYCVKKHIMVIEKAVVDPRGPLSSLDRSNATVLQKDRLSVRMN